MSTFKELWYVGTRRAILRTEFAPEDRPGRTDEVGEDWSTEPEPEEPSGCGDFSCSSEFYG